MTNATLAPAVNGHADPHHARRWWVLAVLAVAQLMVVLDATVVNIALPHAQTALHFSNADRQWVVTAYSLAFGSLLLLGGRLADILGRKRLFLTGVIGFAMASAVGGASVNFAMLVTARAVQGAFGAVLAPAALSLLTTTFTHPAERGKAFGIYGGIAGAGASIGLLLGGVLTEYLDWRWTMYINLVFAVVAATGGLLVLAPHSAEQRQPIDRSGTVLACASMFAIVYGFAHAATKSGSAGWTDGQTIGFLIAGLALLVGFLARERRAPHPLLPPRVVNDRNRGGAYAAMFLASIGLFGVFLFLTYYLETILDFSPVKTGLAFLPMTAAVIVGSRPGQRGPPGPYQPASAGAHGTIAERGRDGPADRDRDPLQLRLHHPAAAAVGGCGAGPGLRPLLQPRHPWGQGRRRRRGVGHGQCGPANRWFHRHGPAQQHRHQRRGRVYNCPRQGPALRSSDGPGGRAQLHRRLLGGRRHFCRGRPHRRPPAAPRCSRPGRQREH